MRAARQFTAVGKPIHSRGSLITTDNGDLACDDVAGRVLERRTPQHGHPARFSYAMTELTGRCSRDRR